jgi:hypothetical protein
MMPIRHHGLMLCALTILLAACAPMRSAEPLPPLKDGELRIPADYKTWPKFLSAVQRPDSKQVREIYMNPAATAGTAAQGFPNGSVFVMENYAAKVDVSGALVTGTDGKLVKGDLLRVFVMGKNQDWGQSAPVALRNGDWVYSAYLANGDKSADPIAACRACHLPVGAGKDFVHRYDEYFSKAVATKAQ